MGATLNIFFIERSEKQFKLLIIEPPRKEYPACLEEQ